MYSFYTRAAEIACGEGRAAACILVQRSGSAPREPGAKMIVFEDGSTEGSIGGNALEQKVISLAAEVIRNRKPCLREFNLMADLGMCCGGRVTVYIEPVHGLTPLVIFGAGHIGKALAGLAAPTGFSVTLVDERENCFDDSIPHEVNKINLPPRMAIKRISFSPAVCILIATHSHSLDRALLALCLKETGGYLGMVGSRRKAILTRRILLADSSLPSDALDRVEMPAGLDIHARHPREIAVSILGRLIQLRNHPETQTLKECLNVLPS